ncbi:MAG: hypothetical protein U1E78_05420 [Gammaproteobacteria bacterium]
MRIIISVFMAIATTNVFAYIPDNFTDKGLYWVGQSGIGSIEFGFLDNMLGSMEMQSNTGFAGRIGIGEQAYRHFAIEAGLSTYPTAVRNYNFKIFNSGQFTGSSKFSDIYSVDLMGMLRAPLGNHFFIGGGAGISVIHFHYSAMKASDGSTTALSWDSGSKHFTAPKAELRIGSKVSQKVSLFLSASHIFSVNEATPAIRDYQPGLNMASIGINYHLGHPTAH